MITLHIPRGLRPALVKTATGLARLRRVTVKDLSRRQGPASFFADRLALRKTLALCTGCQAKLPRRWQQVYDYEALTMFHGAGACDYCRVEGPISLFLAGEGSYWEAYEAGRRMETAVRSRERALYEQDKRFLIGV